MSDGTPLAECVPYRENYRMGGGDNEMRSVHGQLKALYGGPTKAGVAVFTAAETGRRF